MGWLILAGLSALMIWALLHERSMRDKKRSEGRGPVAAARTPVMSPEESALNEQKTVLEAQFRQTVQKNRASEITEAVQNMESESEADQQKALNALNHILHHSPDWEQWNILNLLQEHLKKSYSGQVFNAPLPPTLLLLLNILSSRPRASWKRATGNKEHLNLQDIGLKGLVLAKFNLRSAVLQSCVFTKSQLAHADFYASHVEDCGFKECQLKNTNFTGATVKKSSFSKSNLESSEWISATVESCDFSQTQWSKANVRGVRFFKCTFTGADLSLIKGLTFSQLQSCAFDKHTQLPEVFAHRLQELL